MVDHGYPRLDQAGLWTISDVADHVGLSVSHLMKLRADGELPEPAGQSGRALVWEPQTIETWITARRSPSLLWSLSQAAHELGVTADWLRTQRRKGLLPPPTVDPTPGGKRAQWDPAALRSWQAAQQRPVNGLVRNDILALINRATIPRSSPLPDPDGRFGGQRWWHRDTVDRWWQAHLAQNTRRHLWSKERIERQTRRTWTQLAALPSWADFPAPAEASPERLWDPDAVQTWWQDHATSAGRLRWSAQDVAHNTGLSWDTIRTYRKRGVLPPADGYDGSHPWWHPATIRDWDQTRRPKGRGGRPRRTDR